MTQVTTAEYQLKSTRLASSLFMGDGVDPDFILSIFEDMIDSGKNMDKLKRALFYDDPKYRMTGPRNFDLPAASDRDLIHAVMGMTTEIGEIIETVVPAVDNILDDDHPAATLEIDRTNLREEIGDVLWYIALACKAGGFTIQDAMDSNVAKLAKRYGEKFSTEAALTRNLEVERAALNK